MSRWCASKVVALERLESYNQLVYGRLGDAAQGSTLNCRQRLYRNSIFRRGVCMSHLPSFRFICTFLALWCSAASAGASTLSWGKVSEIDWAATAPEQYPEANAVILHDRAVMQVTPDIIEINYHVRLKALNRAGVDEIGERSVIFHKQHDRIKGFSAQTITPDGKSHKVGGDAQFDKTLGDYVTKTFTFPSLDSGCIIEYKYKLRSERFWYLKPWYFQNRLFTYLSEFTVSLSPGFSYDAEYLNVPLQYQSPTVEERPDPTWTGPSTRYIKKFTWTIPNLPPVREEPYMSCVDDYRSALRFQLVSFRDHYGGIITYIRNWSELGAEFQRWIDVYNNSRGDVKKLAQEIAEGLESPVEQSRALFTYVASEFKTSTELDSKWFLHDKMSQTLSERHGSGEEKNILLVELHKALDIPCWPVLISTRSNARFNPRFPDLQQFNYLIAFAQIGDQWEFLDVSSRYMPYGLLPPDCLTDGGFLIDGDKSELVRITIKPTVSYRCDTTRVYVASDGTAACSTVSVFSGYLASDFSERYEGMKSEEFVKEHYLDNVDAVCTVQDHTAVNDSSWCFTARLNFTSDQLISRFDNNLAVPLISYTFRNNPFESQRRFFPVDFAFPFAYSNVVKVIYSGGDSHITPPQDAKVAIGGASLERRSEVLDSVVTVVTHLTVTEPQFDPFLYASLRNFFDTVAAVAHDEILIATAE